MKRFSFTKMSGTGNDFILFDKKINPGIELTTQNIKDICERRTGIGADGVLLISDLKDFAFEMNYFNADGSTGSLCANGARCAIKYGNESGRISNNKISFIANCVEYSGQLLDNGLVKFFLDRPKKMKQNFKIKAGNQLMPASFVDTGSPHVVIKFNDVLRNHADPKSYYNDFDIFPVYELGKEIRYHKDFAPDGTNVNFIRIHNGEIDIRSYERGVENETLSCGTGTIAAALLVFAKENFNPPIKVHQKSGDELIVDFKIEEQKVRELSLTGPAKIIFNGEITI
ncbi:MAG: diaminopimelate epimerase [Ignavibacteriales bacterium]|nr:MAG: diaminopimelate epimerase [Ignavibacteriales bacterium]